MKRLTIRQACAELHCSRWTLNRLFESGKLHKYKQGHHVSVDAAELRAYIRANGTVNPGERVPSLTPEQIASLVASVDQLKRQLADVTKQVA